MAQRGAGKRRLIPLAIVLVIAVLGAAAAQAKPVVYRVTTTVTGKASPQHRCELPECVMFSGRVNSTKAACARNREVLGTIKIQGGGTYDEGIFGITDAQGRWSHLAYTGGQVIAWLKVRVEPLRLPSGALCQGASAKVVP